MFACFEGFGPLPESQSESGTDVPTIGAMLGFAVMMILDAALG